MKDNYSFNELIEAVRRKYRHDRNFTEYCIEQECFTQVERYGMFCHMHLRETE